MDEYNKAFRWLYSERMKTVFYNRSSRDELLAEKGVTPEDIAYFTKAIESLFSVIELDNDENTIMTDIREMISNANSVHHTPSEDPLDILIEEETSANATRLVEEFGESKLRRSAFREVFYRRIVSDDPESLQSIADSLGLTRQRVQQIEVAIVKKFRDFLVQNNFVNDEKNVYCELKRLSEEFGKSELETDMDRSIFYRRTVNNEPESLQAIADSLGTNRDRVRQIEIGIRNKFRAFLAQNNFEGEVTFKCKY